MCQISVESGDQMLRYWALKSELNNSVRERERERERELQRDIHTYRCQTRVWHKNVNPRDSSGKPMITQIESIAPTWVNIWGGDNKFAIDPIGTIKRISGYLKVTPCLTPKLPWKYLSSNPRVLPKWPKTTFKMTRWHPQNDPRVPPSWPKEPS